jgi:hypothetical protein
MPICTCNTPVLGAPASLIGSELSVYLALGPSFCQSFMVFVPDSGFALVVADRIEFSMDCFPENPSALPQTPENAPGFTRCSSA